MHAPLRSRRQRHGSALLGPLALLALASPVQAQAPAADASDGLAGTVELYGFLPTLNSTTTVRGFEVETTLSPRQLIDRLQATFSARASLEKGRLGLLLDASYNRLGDEPSRTTPRGLFTGTAQINAANGFYDLAARWRLGNRESAVGRPGQGWLIPYAGVRLVQASLDVDAEVRGNGPILSRISLRRQGVLERTWSQPLVGLQGSLFLAPRLRLFARGDLAGFGLGGEEDFSSNAQAGVGYALGNNTDLNVSWRYRTLRYNNGGERSNGYVSDENGVEVGLKFYF